jgi:tRNA/rRNA methyltransferase
MAGAGTDKTKRWVATEGPVVILVEPQLGDNVGAAARAMAKFGLSRLRLVKPRLGGRLRCRPRAGRGDPP